MRSRGREGEKRSCRITEEVPEARRQEGEEAVPRRLQGRLRPSGSAGEFGERADTLKGQLMALLVKGKPVRIADAKKALYGAGNPAPIGGVIRGAEAAFEKAGCKLLKEGKGEAATLTFARK